MNPWPSDYNMPSQFGIPMNPMMQNLIQYQQMYTPMPEIANGNQNGPQEAPLLIGPVAPEVFNNSNEDEHKKDGVHEKSKGSHRVDIKRDRDSIRDKSRRRSRSRDRLDSRSHGRERYDRNRRERRSKWDNDDEQKEIGDPALSGFPGMNQGVQGNMMPGTVMMSYKNMMVPPMDMHNMPGTGMNMIMSNMALDQRVFMQQMANQPIYLPDGVLLPPVPGTPTPNRRSRPPGCRTIFVGGFSCIVKRDMITTIFERFGPIEDVIFHHQGVCHVRFEREESVEPSFIISGSRFRLNGQTDNEAIIIFIDYALNPDDQAEFERKTRQREPTPPVVEPYSPATLTSVIEKIKSDDQFAEAAPTLATWLERGECNKKNANSFYSLIQTTNNQVRRLFNEKMQLDEELHTMRTSLKEKFAHIILQFEQVAKILTAAKHQRVSDHFTKQQRRNIDMWLKMTEEVNNMKEEFSTYFDDDDNTEKPGVSKNTVPLEKYEQLKTENENLIFELEGYKNEAHLAKNEAERKFEKFKAHYIAQQALQNKEQQIYPPLPTPPLSMPNMMQSHKQDANAMTSGPAVPSTEAKIISLLTAVLIVHPLGATLDYLVSYLKSMVPFVTQTSIHNVLKQYRDIFRLQSSAGNPDKWIFVIYDNVKK